MNADQYLCFLCGVGLALFVWRWDMRGHALSYALYGYYLYVTKKLYRIKNLLDDTLSYDIYASNTKNAVSYDTYLRATVRIDEVLQTYVRNVKLALRVNLYRFLWFGLPLAVFLYDYLHFFLLGIGAYGVARCTKHYIKAVRPSEPITTTLILVDYALLLHTAATEEKAAPTDTL